MKSEPDYKAAIDRLEKFARDKLPEGLRAANNWNSYDVIALALIDAGRMVRQGDNAVWPAPPDPDAEYDAAVRRFYEAALLWSIHSNMEPAWRDVEAARAARDAAKGKAVPK
jgi:hypothetical protein